MRLVAASIVLGQAILSYEIINDARSQIQFLRVRRKNSGFFEEASDDDFNRECQEEMCSFEELMEINEHDEVKTKKAWEKLTKQCYENQCNAQGTKLCVQTWNARVCHCKDGWTKTDDKNGKCDEDIDECAIGGNSKCSAEQVCLNNDGSYSCTCASGYRSGDAGSCENVDECAEGHECGSHATCKDMPGAFTCECHDGYYRNEQEQCVDDDECKSDNNCSANSRCENTEGSYECVCDHGYSKNADTGECDDINECENGTDCGNGLCTNEKGGYNCICSVGYENDGDASTGKCVDTNECDSGNVCLSGTCHNTAGSHVCCEDNQDFDENTNTCINRDPCESVLCGDNAHCELGACVCNSGYKREEADEEDGVVPLNTVAPATGSDDEEGGSASGANIIFSGDDAENSVTPEVPEFMPVHAAMADSLRPCVPICICENGTCDSEGVCVCPPNFANLGGVCIDQDIGANVGGMLTTTEAPPETTEEVNDCPAGFGGPDCSDIDECQENNGNCGSMCMNYYGTRRCYEALGEESAMCHHSSESASSIAGYQCTCFNNYHLCNDGFSCVTNDRYNKYNRQGTFAYEGATSCASGRFGINGACFSASSEKATYAGAVEACKDDGGALINLKDRNVWWVVGNNVQYGEAAFWVDADSSSSLMYIYGDATGALLANPAGNMDNVPPQMDTVSGTEMHFYACQF